MNSISSNRSINWPISECMSALFSLTSPWNIHTVRSLRIWRYSHRSKLRRQWEFCRAVLCSWKPCPYTSTSSLHVNNGLHFSTVWRQQQLSASVWTHLQYQCEDIASVSVNTNDHISGERSIFFFAVRPCCRHAPHHLHQLTWPSTHVVLSGVDWGNDTPSLTHPPTENKRGYQH